MSEYKSIFSDKTLGKLRADSAESLKDMLKGKSFMQASMDSMKLLPQIIEAEKLWVKNTLKRLNDEAE